jgi:hypothetical protein
MLLPMCLVLTLGVAMDDNLFFNLSLLTDGRYVISASTWRPGLREGFGWVVCGCLGAAGVWVHLLAHHLRDNSGECQHQTASLTHYLREIIYIHARVIWEDLSDTVTLGRSGIAS